MDNKKWIKIINKQKKILFFLLVIIVNQSRGQLDHPLSSVHSGSQCFHVKGVPTLKLRCPNGELIRVVESFYGTPIGRQEEVVCAYRRGENHCIQLMDMQENCMGRYMCSVYVSNPFLMNCRTYASYMQVNYTCVPRYAIHNICEPRTITTATGYIRSPHYPDANYTSTVHCGCRLETKDKGIILNILDFSVNHTKQSRCESDFLRVGHWGRKCGQIGPERLPEKLQVDKQKVNLEFHSDEYYSSRGFWMEYSGLNGGDVTMSCGHILQNPSKSDFATDDIEDDFRIQLNNGIINTSPSNIYGQKTEIDNSIPETDNKRKPIVYETYELKKAISEILPKDQKQSLSIHPKHLDTYSPFLGDLDFNLPLFPESGFNSHHIKTSNQDINEIDIARGLPLDKYQEELHKKLDWKNTGSNFGNLGKDEEKFDTVYTPHEGPWDIPGADGSSINNVVIKGDWNDGEEIIDIQHSLLDNIHTDSVRSSKKDNTYIQGKEKTDAYEDSHKSEGKEFDIYGIDTVQVTTGIVVGFLILIAVIIIIVLVFRRYPSRF